MIGNVNVPGANSSDIASINTSLSNKVDKISGKILTSNDFTDTYKGKLDNIDTTPTDSSTNLITSGGVYSALNNSSGGIGRILLPNINGHHSGDDLLIITLISAKTTYYDPPSSYIGDKSFGMLSGTPKSHALCIKKSLYPSNYTATKCALSTFINYNIMQNDSYTSYCNISIDYSNASFKSVLSQQYLYIPISLNDNISSNYNFAVTVAI